MKLPFYIRYPVFEFALLAGSTWMIRGSILEWTPDTPWFSWLSLSTAIWTFNVLLALRGIRRWIPFHRSEKDAEASVKELLELLGERHRGTDSLD
jgi:hypothetical protein